MYDGFLHNMVSILIPLHLKLDSILHILKPRTAFQMFYALVLRSIQDPNHINQLSPSGRSGVIFKRAEG